jgi:hypothetical protein
VSDLEGLDALPSAEPKSDTLSVEDIGADQRSGKFFSLLLRPRCLPLLRRQLRIRRSRQRL